MPICPAGQIITGRGILSTTSADSGHIVTRWGIVAQPGQVVNVTGHIVNIPTTTASQHACRAAVIAEQPDCWSIVSDREKGLASAVGAAFPKAAHAACIKHVERNIAAAKAGGVAVNAPLLAAANALTKEAFTAHMQEFKVEHPRAHEYMQIVPPTTWALAHAIFPRFGVITSNWGESLNMAFKAAREEPVMDLMYTLYRWIQQHVGERREKSTAIDPQQVMPGPARRLATASAKAARHKVIISTTDHATVISGTSGKSYVVDVSQRNCSCGAWTQFGVPCSHGCALLARYNRDLNDYVDIVHKAAAYAASYSHPVMPINPEGLTGEGTVAAIVGRRRGRPKKKRIASRGEQASKKRGAKNDGGQPSKKQRRT